MESVLPALPVENGSTDSDMAAEEESWEQKEEPGGGGGGDTGGGGSSEQENIASGMAGQEKPDEEMMEEEEEEILMPKVASVPPDAPKKEHVNVVFIGHVGKSCFSACFFFFIRSESINHRVFLSLRCWQVNYWGTDHVSNE